MKAGLVLTPGASATRDHAALVAVDRRVSSDDVVVERINLPSRAPAAIDAVRAAANSLAEGSGIPQDRVALGGRSFGGRMCSMAVAEGLPALGLVLISYPLHPPGKPTQLRVEHFPEVRVPCLFVSGTKDPFGTPDELEKAVKAIRGPVTLHFLDKGSHGLSGRDAELADLVAETVASWVH
jgi:predicted alpha/beta-hydrolase family hydrolase